MILTFPRNLVENDDSFRYLARANNISELIWKAFFKVVIVGFPAIDVVVAIGSVVMCWIHHETLDAEYFFHPFKIM